MAIQGIMDQPPLVPQQSYPQMQMQRMGSQHPPMPAQQHHPQHLVFQQQQQQQQPMVMGQHPMVLMHSQQVGAFEL